MRRTVITVLTALVAVVALGAGAFAINGGQSAVTRARLERSLPVTFANLYAQQARLEGRAGITPASLHAHAMCDKGGADSADVGPGGDWNCLMSWTDPQVPMPAEGYGKFELNVHSNGCYTASGPSKLVGFLTLTDRRGRIVDNPVFEFDGCFDPAGDDSPTGVSFPSSLTVTSTSAQVGADGTAAIQVSCGTGAAGCAGTVTAMAGGTPLGSADYDVVEERTATLRLPRPVPAGAGEVTLSFTARHGVAPGKPTTLTVEH